MLYTGLVTRRKVREQSNYRWCDGRKAREFHPTNMTILPFFHLLQKRRVVLVHLFHVWLVGDSQEAWTTWMELLQYTSSCSDRDIAFSASLRLPIRW